jgi:hypothetical protein
MTLPVDKRRVLFLHRGPRPANQSPRAAVPELALPKPSERGGGRSKGQRAMGVAARYRREYRTARISSGFAHRALWLRARTAFSSSPLK